MAERAVIAAASYIVMYIIILWQLAGIWNDKRSMFLSILAVSAYRVKFPRKKLTLRLQCTRVIHHVCHLNARALEVHRQRNPRGDARRHWRGPARVVFAGGLGDESSTGRCPGLPTIHSTTTELYTA